MSIIQHLSMPGSAGFCGSIGSVLATRLLCLWLHSAPEDRSRHIPTSISVHSPLSSPEVYRFDIDLITSPSPSIESNDSIQTFWIISGWLHCASVLQVSCFDFYCLTDFRRYEFDSSASLSMPNVSVQAVWISDG